MARNRDPLGEALGFSTAEDRPAATAPSQDIESIMSQLSLQPEPEEASQGLLGNSQLAKIFRAALPAIITGVGPDMGGFGEEAFGQSFGQNREKIEGLARSNEQQREKIRRENALLLFETFQNNPGQFAAMDAETLMSIAEPVAEQLNQPVEQIIQLMQQQAASAAKLSPSEATNLASTAGSLGQPEVAEKAIQQISGFEGTQLQPITEKDELTDDEVARFKSTFTKDTADTFLALRQQGMSPGQAALESGLQFRSQDTSEKERQAASAASKMRRGEEPDPIEQLAFNDYYNVAESELSPSNIANIHLEVSQLANTLAVIDPDNPKAIEFMANATATSRQIANEVSDLVKTLRKEGKSLLPEQLQDFTAKRAMQLARQGGTTEAPAAQEAAQIKVADAAIAKARTELGPEADFDDVVERATEIMDGNDE